MNVIQSQADDLIKFKLREDNDYKDFLSDVRSHLYEYKKTVHKVEFTERVINITKIKYDKHLEVCTEKTSGKCKKNKYFENVLFFLQEELEEFESELTPEDFTRAERNSINEGIKQILADLDKIKLGQQITYDDFKEEFEELKDFYFLNKKNWKQLFAGKITEMVAGGIISETVSKDLVDLIQSSYTQIAGK